MKAPQWFKSKDASNIQILLLFIAILIDTVLYFPPEPPAKKEPPINHHLVPLLAMRRHCYDIPYSREQLAEIWTKGDIKKKKAIQDKLAMELTGEDIHSAVGHLLVFYGEDTTTICIDFKYELNTVPDLESRLT